ncbi:MAG: hypothetical protein ACRDSP_19995 [Pseudonocardiaceae bacterium]
MNEPNRRIAHHHDGSGGLTRSITPGVSCPETVLAVVMSDGAYLLVGYPQGEPAAFIAADDADLIRHALTTAFGHPEGAPLSAHCGGSGVSEAQL